VKSSSRFFVLIVLLAELGASAAVWHGTPSDWVGEPLSFWHYELLRLRFWLLFSLLGCGFWLLVWVSLRRFASSRVLLICALVCALAAEIGATTYFWRSLKHNEQGFLGWPFFQSYFREHLISWLVIFAIFAVGACYIGRQMLTQPRR
jgi:hypothetical protein